MAAFGTAPATGTTRKRKRTRRDVNQNGIPDSEERRSARTGSTVQGTSQSPRAGKSGDPAGVRSAAGASRSSQSSTSSTAPSSSGGLNSTVPELQGMAGQRSRTKFGRQFTPDMGLKVLDNPEIAASAFMHNQGMDPMRGGGMTDVLNDLAAAMPDLFFLSQGASGKDNALFGVGAPSFLDFAGQFLKGQSQPGGAFVSPALAGNIFGGGESPLSAFLNNPAHSTEQQVGNAIGMLRSALGTTIPASILEGILGMANQQGIEFMSQLAQGKDRGQTFTDALAKNTPIDEWLGVGGGRR